MIELSRTQDEEVGDGTTSVIILGMFFCVHFNIFMNYYLNYTCEPILHYSSIWSM